MFWVYIGGGIGASYHFLKSVNRKSANSRAHFAIAKSPNVLRVPLRKFVWLIRKSQIRKFLQNTVQLCLKTVPKVVFLNDFYDGQIWICFIIKTKSIYLQICGSFKSANHKKSGSKNRKSAQCQICGKSADLTNLWFAELICVPPHLWSTQVT